MFYQNGSWNYNNLVGPGLFDDEDLLVLPIYFGVGDEGGQGLCTGTENFWCVNRESSPQDIQATLDFMYWCVTSPQGVQAMADMGFVIPFQNALAADNVFARTDQEMTAAGKTPVGWSFLTIPSKEWKNGVGAALTSYATGSGDWQGVVTAFVDGWAAETARKSGG